jgi:hypothetical protein
MLSYGSSRILLLLTLVLGLVTLPSCTPPPPTLTPEAHWAFNETRTIKGLDVLRDTLVAANKETPPLVSQTFMLATVKYHRSALVLVHAHALGWQGEVAAGADELIKDLPPNEAQLARPYIALLKTILAEVK